MPRPQNSPFSKIAISADHELAGRIEAYHQALLDAGVSGHPADTIRELISLGLAADPLSVITIADRKRSYTEARVYFFIKASNLFADIAREMNEAIEPGKEFRLSAKYADSEAAAAESKVAGVAYTIGSGNGNQER